MLGEEGQFPHSTPQNSPTPVGCPNIQFCPYLQIASDSTSKRLSPTRLPCTSEAKCKPRQAMLLTNQLQTRGSNNTVQLRMPIASPDCYLHFRPIGYKSEVPTTPSLALINFSEGSQNSGSLFYLLDDPFLVKGYNSGTARWKRCIG